METKWNSSLVSVELEDCVNEEDAKEVINFAKTNALQRLKLSQGSVTLLIKDKPILEKTVAILEVH